VNIVAGYNWENVMDAWQSAFEATAAVEGGWVNDPEDRGGETYAGITRRDNPDPALWDRVDDYKRRLRVQPTQKRSDKLDKQLRDDAELWVNVKFAYFERYWKPVCGNQLAELSAAVALEVYDTGVNMGTGTAGRILQAAVNLMNRNARSYPDIMVDGAIGPRTLGAVRKCIEVNTAERLVVVLNGEQYVRYREIVLTSPGQERFFNGWIEHRLR